MKKLKVSEYIQQAAIIYAGDRTKGYGHGYPSAAADGIELGYITGAMAERALQEENMVKLLTWVSEQHYDTCTGMSKNKGKWIKGPDIVTSKEIVAAWKEYESHKEDRPAKE